MYTQTLLDNSDVKLNISSLLQQAGMKSEFSCQRIMRGGNNQSFRIENSDGIFFLKFYFQHPADLRNRLDAEFKFIQFCNEKKISCVPKALACDVNNALALYSWVEGTVFNSKPNQSDILEAALFLKFLAAHSTSDAVNMPFAADACFTLSDHINSTEQRLQNLCVNVAENNTFLFQEVKKILQLQLVPLWEDIKRQFYIFINTKKIEYISPWILSPSDFGFHNALKTGQGIVFLDFEYAGRDGLVKTLCDFVCQPEYPVPETAMEILLQTIYENTEQEELLLNAKAILPVCRLKWCCIMLNQFTKIGASRRAFAIDKNLEIQQEIQLQKVQNYINMHFY